ncbi:hypothetical protein Mapa_008824 [Marchantia paleacea]|nr:hypothetical protein Mapa_008824 [Marchantia paleacea]
MAPARRTSARDLRTAGEDEGDDIENYGWLARSKLTEVTELKASSVSFRCCHELCFRVIHSAVLCCHLRPPSGPRKVQIPPAPAPAPSLHAFGCETWSCPGRVRAFFLKPRTVVDSVSVCACRFFPKVTSFRFSESKRI